MRKKAKRIYLGALHQPESLGELKALPRDPLNHPKVLRLKEVTAISRLIKPLETDLEQALEIARFTSEAWEHDGFHSDPKKKDALSVLAEAQKGVSFACTQFGSVFVQLCHSVGIPARSLQVRTKRPEFGTSGHGHVTAEYFDNQYGKWIWIDPQIHAMAWQGKKPLSFNEFSELVVAKKKFRIQFSSRTLDYVNGNRKHLKTLETFVKRYVWSSRVGAYDAFFTPQFILDARGCMRDGVLPPLTFQGFANSTPTFVDRACFDAPLNACTLRFETQGPKRKVFWKDVEDYKQRAHLNYALAQVKIFIQHNAPWFSHYELIFNGKKRKLRSHHVVLPLKSGKNTLEICPVNEAGRRGVQTSAVIHYDNKHGASPDYW